MTTFVDTVFSSQFEPKGSCFLWRPELVWLHTLSDLTIALAYFAIPITIILILRIHKKTLPFSWVFAMFAIFIFFSGLTHLVGLISMWQPIYYIEGLVKIITAAVSIATALVMFPLIPVLIKKFEELDQLIRRTEDH